MYLKNALPQSLMAGLHLHTHLIDLSDPPVDAVKGPAVCDVIHQQDPLETHDNKQSHVCL